MYMVINSQAVVLLDSFNNSVRESMLHILEDKYAYLNRPVACKGSRMQLFLIAVASRLDAVVACINVFHPMENQ